jgi:hypothetical protein
MTVFLPWCDFCGCHGHRLPRCPWLRRQFRRH